MKTMSKFKRGIVLVLALLMAISAALPAFAYSSSQCSDAYSSLSSEYKSKVTVNYSGDDATISVDGTTINGYKTKTYGDSQGESVTSVTIGGDTVFLTSSGVDELYNELKSLGSTASKEEQKKTAKNAKEKVGNMITAFSPQADIEGAASSLSGLKDSLGILLGIAAYLVLAGLSLFTACDLLYITIPFFRNGMDNVAQSGNGSGMGSSTSKSTGETKFRWITDEAMYAVKTATIESGQSAIFLYLKKRIWAVMAVAVAIYILLTGNIGLIMNLALNLVSGLIDVIANLGA